jgi:hypothetical protein
MVCGLGFTGGCFFSETLTFYCSRKIKKQVSRVRKQAQRQPPCNLVFSFPHGRRTRFQVHPIGPGAIAVSHRQRDSEKYSFYRCRSSGLAYTSHPGDAPVFGSPVTALPYSPPIKKDFIRKFDLVRKIPSSSLKKLNRIYMSFLH